jgi:hypothetical protein
MKSSLITATTSPLRTAMAHIAAAETLISEADIAAIKSDTRDYVILAVGSLPDRLIVSNAVASLARSANARVVIVNGDSPALIISASVMGVLGTTMTPESFSELIRKLSQYSVSSGKFSVIEVNEKYCAKSARIEDSQSAKKSETKIVLEKIKLPDGQLSEIASKALERFNTGNYQDTLPLIRQVTASRRDITDAFFIQGVTEAKLGLLPEAARSLNAVLEVNSGHTEATRLLGEIRAALGY